ncbi:hypothetical protein FB382_001497 [Nocardioides ginsengisegetis]|uniref:Uncharacterized protein n=1 Tax=Nocardioides ginsengisegetis TaxID=661491 RepID=A0A7W3IZ05_9ACTN|nr:hypothetical protein [Nocardioides ginsengisegetis]MBA8803206.1 hypothetical protein [Nocardioides ginsengisegetis]
MNAGNMHRTYGATRGESGVPVVMPQVEVGFGADGSARVTVEQSPYDDGPVSRNDLEGLLGEIATTHGPIRVLVTESDGSQFTDIVLPGTTRHGTAPPTPGADGSGFLPDEDIAVAFIVAHRQADAAGHARLRLPPAAVQGMAGSVVLIGRTSGRCIICEMA